MLCIILPSHKRKTFMKLCFSQMSGISFEVKAYSTFNRKRKSSSVCYSWRNPKDSHYQLLSFGLRQESQTDEDFLFRLKVDFKRAVRHVGEASFANVSLLYEFNIIQSIKMPLSMVQPNPYGTCVYCSDNIDSASKAESVYS